MSGNDVYMSPGYVKVDAEKAEIAITRVTKTLGCSKTQLSKNITGSTTALWSYKRGAMKEVWLDALESMYNIKKADLVVEEDLGNNAECETKSEDSSEMVEMLKKLIEAVENVSLEIRALKNKVDQVGSDLSSDINELHQMINAKPTPIAPADLKKIIVEGTYHDKTDEIMRGLKCSKDMLIETVSFGINKSLQKQEANRRK